MRSPVRCPVRWQRHSKSHCQTHRAVSFWVREPTQLAPAHPARTSTPTSRDSHSRLSPPNHRTADRPGSPSLGAPIDTPPATPGPALPPALRRLLPWRQAQTSSRRASPTSTLSHTRARLQILALNDRHGPQTGRFGLPIVFQQLGGQSRLSQSQRWIRRL